MASPLPGYTYDPVSSRYRSSATGRYVSRDAINSLLDSHVAATEARLVQLTDAYFDGQIAPSVWAEQMRTEVKRLYLQNGAMGAGGWDQMTQADYGRIGGKLRAEYGRLADFAQAVQDGTVSRAQAAARVQGYAGGARGEYYDSRRGHRRTGEGAVPIEKRNLDPAAKHCRDCPGYSDRGWAVAGTLPRPGAQCACGNHCRCTMEEREVPAGEVGEWIGTRRRT